MFGKQKWKKLVCLSMALTIMLETGGEAAVWQQNPFGSLVTDVQAAEKSKTGISKKTRNAYFAQSAFIGSSIGLGQRNYFQSQGKGFLGEPVMLVKGCYSFSNDDVSSAYCLDYKGRKYKAKDAVAAAGVKRVFINMGTNDLWKSAADTYQDYVKYIRGIRKKNPDVVIFIESTAPMVSASERTHLNNAAINELNRLIREYCDSHKDIYYIDISKGLRDSGGGLKREYSSDGYVHISTAGYRIWTSNVVSYVEKLLQKEADAKKLVRQADRSLDVEDYKKARNAVQKLEKSTVRSDLQKQLEAIQERRQQNDTF